MKVFVLKDSNSEATGTQWFRIDQKDVDKWMTDGSLEPGDMVVIPKTVMRVIAEKKLHLSEER